jgi:hypothetical protein
VEIARELMADDGVQVVQVVLSATHPAPDQCDYFALANRYGLGPGCYPKAVTPRPPFHPHCRCYLRQRGDLSATHAREDPAAARTFLSRLDPKDAARVAGSRAKRDEMLKGTAPETIWNAKRPEAYKIGRVGDAMLADVKPSAFEIAQTDGSPHHRWMLQQRKLPTVNLLKSVRTFQKQIAQHEGWIADPWSKCEPGHDPEKVRYYQTMKWPSDIARQREQINIIEGVLHERGSHEK